MKKAGALYNELINVIKDEIKVFIPCKVTAVNTSKQTVKVQIESGLIIADVPIWAYAVASDQYISMPVKVGTQGGLIIADNDISGFLNSAKQGSFVKSHDLSDCFFIAGFSSKSARHSGTADDIAIVNSNMSVIIHKDGKIEIKNVSNSDVIKLVSNYMGYLSDVTNALMSATVATAIGSQPLDPATIATLATKYALMQSDKSLFDAMKV